MRTRFCRRRNSPGKRDNRAGPARDRKMDGQIHWHSTRPARRWIGMAGPRDASNAHHPGWMPHRFAGENCYTRPHKTDTGGRHAADRGVPVHARDRRPGAAGRAPHAWRAARRNARTRIPDSVSAWRASSSASSALVNGTLNCSGRLSEMIYLRPPFRPPLRDALLLSFLPRPLPLFFPPWLSLFTVAHARRDASFLLTPRFL